MVPSEFEEVLGDVEEIRINFLERKTVIYSRPRILALFDDFPSINRDQSFSRLKVNAEVVVSCIESAKVESVSHECSGDNGTTRIV